MERIGEASGIAAAVIFLAGLYGRWMNGGILRAEGELPIRILSGFASVWGAMSCRRAAYSFIDCCSFTSFWARIAQSACAGYFDYLPLTC